MAIDIERIHDLYLALLCCEISPEDSRELRELLMESPEMRKEFRDFREIWIASGVSRARTRFDSDKAFERFMQTVTPSSRKVRWMPWLAGAAAAAAVIIAVAGLTFKVTTNKIERSYADIVVEAPLGSRTRVVLPDSTEVWLQAGSRISYSQGFGVKERTVHLTGEGHFDVTKDSSRPFSVNTKELTVKVLGTKFNFRNYTEDKEAVVVLEEGRVALMNNVITDSDGYLNPNQGYVMDKASGSGRIYSTEAERSTRWIQGHLFFDDALITDIAKELERCYNVNILIADDSLKNCRFYGDFTQDDVSIDEILEVFNSTGRIRCKRNGKEVTFYR